PTWQKVTDCSRFFSILSGNPSLPSLWLPHSNKFRHPPRLRTRVPAPYHNQCGPPGRPLGLPLPATLLSREMPPREHVDTRARLPLPTVRSHQDQPPGPSYPGWLTPGSHDDPRPAGFHRADNAAEIPGTHRLPLPGPPPCL